MKLVCRRVLKDILATERNDEDASAEDFSRRGALWALPDVGLGRMAIGAIHADPATKGGKEEVAVGEAENVTNGVRCQAGLA